MNNNSINNKRIAKNTIILYFRMLLLLVISLYTSRIVLNALGIVNFGIYNVVGGVVVFLSFLNNTLSTSSSRFITVALGEGNINNMKKIFSSIMLVHVGLCIIVIIISETIGLWFLLHKLLIPEERMSITIWVYQISIITTVINIVSVPYNAIIIAHEKMSAFAYISILDAALKLLTAFILIIVPFDRLLCYALLLFAIQLLDRIIYNRYCLRKFKECRFHFNFDKIILKEMFSFIGWSAYGSLASVSFNEGLNILLNMFFNPAVNAARGLSVQIQNAIVGFTNNFQTAINPQIIKSFVAKDFEYEKKLLIASTKFSIYLLMLLSIPVIFETHYILHLWLKQVPEHTIWFTRLILIISIISSTANPLRMINQAEGNIKKFQLYECTILLLIVPVSWIILKYEKIAELVLFVHLSFELLAQIVRVYIVVPKIEMKISYYLSNIYARLIPVFIIVAITMLIAHLSMVESFLRLVVSVISSSVACLISIYFVGLNTREKEMVQLQIKKIHLWIKF